MRLPVLCLPLLIVTLSGCADLFVINRSLPRSGLERLGPAPTAAEREALALNRFLDIAIDPDSVKVRGVSEPTPGWVNGGLWGWILGGEGWMWSVQFNGRNRLGGYAGWQTYRMLYDPQSKTLWHSQPHNGIYPLDVKD